MSGSGEALRNRKEDTGSSTSAPPESGPLGAQVSGGSGGARPQNVPTVRRAGPGIGLPPAGRGSVEGESEAELDEERVRLDRRHDPVHERREGQGSRTVDRNVVPGSDHEAGSTLSIPPVAVQDGEARAAEEEEVLRSRVMENLSREQARLDRHSLDVLVPAVRAGRGPDTSVNRSFGLPGFR